MTHFILLFTQEFMRERYGFKQITHGEAFHVKGFSFDSKSNSIGLSSAHLFAEQRKSHFYVHRKGFIVQKFALQDESLRFISATNFILVPGWIINSILEFCYNLKDALHTKIQGEAIK